jgi:uncharacterized protein YbbC (DUF1343 family)
LKLVAVVALAVCALCFAPGVSEAGPVKLGIDVLREQQFAPLAGKRVAVVTNHTGVDSNGTHLVQLLLDHKVHIVKLFSPEHGLYGVKDEKVGDMTDEKTGLPVVSLYGKTRRPTPEMLAGVDVLVFDIQDVGARYYTYISTMGYCMEEAAKAKVAVVVLDRPNPIGGDKVEGPIATEKHLGFTAYKPIPVVHGMTVGELAKMFNAVYDIKCDLTVVPMQGWTRDMLWDETGVKWINPSPNMRSPTQAMLYPAIGLLEAGNISVGRGTDTPFELFGAPYIDGTKLAARLTAMNLKGLKFEPVTFTPTNTSHVYNNKECHGVRVTLTDPKGVDSVAAGCAFAWVLAKDYPDWKRDSLVKMVQNDEAVDRVLSLDDPTKCNTIWAAELEQFKAVRAKYLMY